MRHDPFFALLLIGILVTSCTDKLSNARAGQIIKEKYHFPVIEDEMIETGLFAYERDSLPQFYYRLQQQGMVAIESLGKGGLFIPTYRFRVTPSAAAKKYVTMEDSRPVRQGNSGESMYRSRYKTCEVNFEAIESVREIPAMNAAEVRYRVRRVSFTPFWSYYLSGSNRMPDTVQIRPFKLIKSNDGWKSSD